MQTSAERSAELWPTAVCYNETTSFTGECTEPAQTFAFIRSISGNNTDLTCSKTPVLAVSKSDVRSKKAKLC